MSRPFLNLRVTLFNENYDKLNIFKKCISCHGVLESDVLCDFFK